MSDFKVKMHQIVCRLGSLQRSLRPPSWILGALLLRGRGREGKGREGEGGEKKAGKERGRRGRKRNGERRRQGRPPKLKIGPTRTTFLAPALLAEGFE